MASGFTCVFCNEDGAGYGYNPAPVKDTGRCCDDCHAKIVIPRQEEHEMHKETMKSVAIAVKASGLPAKHLSWVLGGGPLFCKHSYCHRVWHKPLTYFQQEEATTTTTNDHEVEPMKKEWRGYNSKDLKAFEQEFSQIANMFDASKSMPYPSPGTWFCDIVGFNTDTIGENVVPRDAVLMSLDRKLLVDALHEWTCDTKYDEEFLFAWIERRMDIEIGDHCADDDDDDDDDESKLASDYDDV